jgi:hemolysin activation/secretion protein
MTTPLKSRCLILSSSMRHAFLTTALAAVTGIAVLAPVQQADAASNLFDLFRQKREAREAAQQQPQPVQQAPQVKQPVARTAKPAATANVAKPAAPVAKAVAVKGRQVFDYRPEKLVKVDFTTVDMQVTAAISEKEGSLSPSALYTDC